MERPHGDVRRRQSVGPLVGCNEEEQGESMQAPDPRAEHGGDEVQLLGGWGLVADLPQ